MSEGEPKMISSQYVSVSVHGTWKQITIDELDEMLSRSPYVEVEVKDSFGSILKIMRVSYPPRSYVYKYASSPSPFWFPTTDLRRLLLNLPLPLKERGETDE